MDLRNTKQHMLGARVTVCGRVYQLDEQGVVRGVEEEHARRLLLGRDWIPVPPILGASQTPIPPVAPKAAPVPPVPPVVPVEAPPFEVDLGPVSELKEAPRAKEWPEPTMEMKGSYLRKMADAFGVEISPRASKTEIVELIKQAMYVENPGSEPKGSAG